MLCNHGVIPSKVMEIPLKERLYMWQLLVKEMKEVKARGKNK